MREANRSPFCGRGPLRQAPALWFCWLSLAGHAKSGPPVPDDVRQAEDDRLFPVDDAIASLAAGPGRRLAATYPFFVTSPYVNVVVFDSNDANCDRNYESPPESNPANAGYPRDATDVVRKKNMACGVAPARFVFTTSDLADYLDTTILARMQVRITCHKARFIESDDCDGVLDATGNFPNIDGCRFQANEARFTLQTRLLPDKRYSITLKMMQPSGQNTASENSFDLTTEYFQMKVIEGTMSPVDISHTVPNAKDEVFYADADYQNRGYITSFTWAPQVGFYIPSPGFVDSVYTFAIRTFGVMRRGYQIDVIAYPTDVWKLGDPGTACKDFDGPYQGTTCSLASFTGASASESNGFTIVVGSSPMQDIGYGANSDKGTFSLKLTNPTVSMNSYWTATSYLFDSNDMKQQPYTIMLDKPVSVLGKPEGEIIEWDLASVGIEQWVELEFKPGSTLMPSKPGITAGILVIIPPPTFTIITTSNPQPPDAQYNALPCATWPEVDRKLGRWICTLEDRSIFKDTTYRVRLKVKNPSSPGAARSWRAEIWQTDATKPISITRSVRGMPVSGSMVASLSQSNQMLGLMNTLQIEFTPSQDVGNVVNTRLEVIAPPGFIIIKRCLGYEEVFMPTSTCAGNNLNRFALTMSQADALKADTTYIFKIDVENPTENVDSALNYWTFNTVRPDGIGRDTARYVGFNLYPFTFQTFSVLPESRRTGSQLVVVRFTPKYHIPFDDYLRVRAPVGVTWDSGNLEFSSDNSVTDARTFGAKDPLVIFETPNYLEWQLTTAAEANFEYGIRGRIIIPQNTPVPNMWWIEQFRQTGQSPPNQWRDIASMGAPGFQSQVLIRTSLTPFNVVEEAWQNPALITFEATVAVQPLTITTALGSTLIPAEVFLEAPAGFTYICPLTETIYMPEYHQALPSNMRCEVDHQNEAERNQLHLYFDDGLQAGIRYAFTIDVVNAPYINPSANSFTLQTRVNGVMQEESILSGWLLAKRMDNTRYLAGATNLEDRRVEMTGNQVTFIIGTTAALSATQSILEVKAPVGFKFKYDCTQDVKWATYVANMISLDDSPVMQSCMSQELTKQREVNKAHVTLTGAWPLGSYGIYAKVENPMFTPLRNFWGFTIFESPTMVPLMSEAWVYGFEIKVVLPSYYPGLVANNPGNGISGEAAMNIIDISFSLTTPLSKDGRFVVTAPVDFRFPQVCRSFHPCLDCNKGTGIPVVPGTSVLSPFTQCYGNSARVVTLYDFKSDLLAKTMYSFRVLVVNPKVTFTAVDQARWWWRYESQIATAGVWNMEDLHKVIPSFPVYQRLRYFVVDTLTRMGLQTTTLRFHFRTTSPVPPQQTIVITAPEGMQFYGVRSNNIDGACSNEDPVLISRQFPTPLISGVTRLPEWISCVVTSTSTIQLKNDESLLGGRPLISGPVYEVFLRNVTNPVSSPYLNIFKIVAKTTEALGQEVWAADGYVIYPELTDVSVVSTNEAFGLYSTFKVEMRVITEVPPRGSILITAPSDYYFGPVILTATNFNDPLNPLPPPSGESPPRPPAGQTVIVEIMRADGWTCPFDFDPCVELTRPTCQATVSCMTEKTTACNLWQDKCASGDLSRLMLVIGYDSKLEITLLPEVAIPQRTLFRFNVQGYNTRLPTEDSDAPNGGGNWNFVTRNSDSEKTVLDKKENVIGIDLMGVIYMNSLVPEDTKIGVVENRVKITIMLTNVVPPKARLVITHPAEFMRNANAAFDGALINLGVNFPRSVDKTTVQNIITLEALDEAFQANVPLLIDIGLSNPDISPAVAANIWTFETSTDASGSWVQQNCNRNVSGFKIYGQFGIAMVTATVLSPTANTIVACRFNLKSALPFNANDGFGNNPNVGSRIRIWMPLGWQPLPNCGTGDVTYPYSREYNPFREGVKFPFEAPPAVTYFEIPPGTDCINGYDGGSGQHYILLLIDGLVDYGLDYAFEFGATNPRYTPAADQNVWRFETLSDGVILHLRQNVPGFTLEQIEEVTVTPGDTTTQVMNRITFYMMSDKHIPGGSTIQITAPVGYEFTCAFFRTDEGLSATTTCGTRAPNRAEFVIDTQDPKAPRSPFRLYVRAFNPEFTPQVNEWAFNILSPLKRSIDIRDKVTGFDITGRISPVNISATFPYLGEMNPLRIEFLPSTIMNQADNGNELFITAPPNYIFYKNCTGFYLRTTQTTTTQADTSGYPSSFVFPPPGIKCEGFDNEQVLITLPDGAGLLRNRYLLELEVYNPPGFNYSVINNQWSFITRVRNSEVLRIVDANRSINGFELQPLVPLNLDESAAVPTQPWCSILALAWLVTQVVRLTAER
mmetsp:Transcript_104385/g.164729  ORF Transcript_104385/g.164729 Transcript_104385/m.164729 type:complete len:2315 (-) Transcript_104385:164-7108(-)